MKNRAAIFLLPFIILTVNPNAKAEASKKEVSAKKIAIIACDDLSRSQASEWSMWAASQGLTKSDLKGFVFNMCISGVSTAMDADRGSDIDEWQIAMFNRNASLGMGPINVSAVQRSTQIAKNYYSQVKKNSSDGARE